MTFIPYGIKEPYKYKHLSVEDKKTMFDLAFVRFSVLNNFKENMEVNFSENLLECPLSNELVALLKGCANVEIDDKPLTYKDLFDYVMDRFADWIDSQVCELGTSLIDSYKDLVFKGDIDDNTELNLVDVYGRESIESFGGKEYLNE